MPELKVPNTEFSLQLKDTIEDRETIVKQFAGRCEEIVHEALRWAPRSTCSHLLEYVRKVQASGGASHHGGLSLATECVLQYHNQSQVSTVRFQNLPIIVAVML